MSSTRASKVFTGAAVALLIAMPVDMPSLGASDPAKASRAPVTALAFSPAGVELVVGSQDGLRVERRGDTTATVALETDLEHIHDLAFSPDGRLLAAAGGKPAETGELELWSWPARERVLAIRPHDDLIYAVAWSPDSSELATASYDGRAGVCSTTSGKRRLEIRGHSKPLLAVAYTLDGRTLITAGVDRSLRVWDAGSGKRRRVLENHTDAVHDIAIRPGATDALPMLASVSTDRTVRLWQPTIGRLVRFTRLDAEPLAVAWSSDGELVVVGCGDGSVRLIDPETVESVATERVLEKVWAVAVSPKHGAAVAAGTPLGESGRSLSRSISMRTRTSDRTREEP